MPCSIYEMVIIIFDTKTAVKLILKLDKNIFFPAPANKNQIENIFIPFI